MTRCQKSCDLCHIENEEALRAYAEQKKQEKKVLGSDSNCPYDPTVPTHLQKPGDLNRLFLNLTAHVRRQDNPYKLRIISMPIHDENNRERNIDDDDDDDIIHDGPWLVKIENFLTDEECDYLANVARVEKGRFKLKNNPSRTSTISWCKEEYCLTNPITRRVLRKLEDLTGVPDPNTEYLQLLEYHVGEYYRTHNDFIHEPKPKQEGPRILTVFLYLNDVVRGGGTNFPRIANNVTIMPRKGAAVVWSSVLDESPNERDTRTMHQALPVEEGVKYAANAWMHQRDFKAALARNCIKTPKRRFQRKIVVT